MTVNIETVPGALNGLTHSATLWSEYYIIFVLQMRKLRHIELLSYFPQISLLASWCQAVFLATGHTIFCNMQTLMC